MGSDRPETGNPFWQVSRVSRTAPAPQTYDPQTRGVKSLLSELTKRKGLASVKISKPGFSLELNGGKA